MQPSKYQAAVYEWIREGTGNAVVDAVAGSGKTTTIVDALRFIPADASVLFLAFNRHIAQELKVRVPSNVRVATLNSFGWGAVMGRCPSAALDDRKTAKTLKRRVFGLHPESSDDLPATVHAGERAKPFGPDVHVSREAAELIGQYRQASEKARRKLWRDTRAVYERIVGLLKAVGARDGLAWASVAGKYGVDLGDLDGGILDLVIPPLFAAVAGNLAVFDFDDQCFAPVHNCWPVRRYDWIIGDEIQDWTRTQTALALKAIDPRGGRFLGVGDPYQSIYGFRGADFNSVPNIVEAVRAVKLPLSVCYRCPTAVVAAAARIVPHIEPAPGKAEGSVETTAEGAFESAVRPGDYVLCRTTAPLVAACFEQIRRGRPATVKGRDIGAGLVALVERIATPKGAEGPDLGMPAEAFLRRLVDWKDDQVAKLVEAEKEEEIAGVEDRFEVLCVFAEKAKAADVAGITGAIAGLFSEPKSEDGMIVFATVHRSKGLQAPTVWILKPELMPFPKAKGREAYQQELNLKYVAITRAQERLIWVESEEAAKAAPATEAA